MALPRPQPDFQVGPLSGEAEPEKTQQVLAIPGPSSGDTEGNERGRGLGHWLCPTCPVLPQALFESPPPSQTGAHLPLSPPALPSALLRLRPARRSPGPEQAGGVRLGPAQELGRPETQPEQGGPQAGGAGSRGQAVIPELGPRATHPPDPSFRACKLHSHPQSFPPRLLPHRRGVNTSWLVQFQRPRGPHLGQAWAEAAAEVRTPRGAAWGCDAGAGLTAPKRSGIPCSPGAPKEVRPQKKLTNLYKRK